MAISTQTSPETRPAIGPSDWDHILKLVGIMAVANGRLIKEDIDAYQDVMMELRVIVDPKLVMTPHMIRDWFIYHRDELTALVDGLEYDSELIAIFKNIRSFPFKLDVVTAMMRVGIADGDYGRMEKMFIKKTILYWNIRSGEAAENQLDNTIVSDIKAAV